jgi:GT2 family glycosyltransferase
MLGNHTDTLAPRVTVSLVTFNGLKWLPGCFASIRAQTLAPIEVLVIDNASTDGTAEWLRAETKRDARIRLGESAYNLGFAKPHNQHIFQARGEFVCLLNQDVELDPRYLQQAAESLRARSDVAAIQGRLRRLGPNGERMDILDSTGLVVFRNRRIVSRCQGERDDPREQEPGPVWGVDGPAPVYRRSALLAARVPSRTGGWEVLDEDFFMYKEDVDLAWRLGNLGWKASYVPSALAWHARGTGGSLGCSVFDLVRADRTIPRWIKAISWRNHRLMQVKNESLSAYAAALPWIAKRELMSLAFMAVVDPRRLRIVPSLIRSFPWAMRKRRYLNRLRAMASNGSRQTGEAHLGEVLRSGATDDRFSTIVGGGSLGCGASK